MQDDAAFGGRMQADLFSMRAAAGPFDIAGEAAAIEHAALFGGLLARVDPLEVADQLRGDAAAGLAGGIAGADLREQCLRLTGREILLRATRDQLEQQLVGYPVRPKSLYFRRGLIPSWSKPTLVIRNENILTPSEADPIAPGDYIYLLAPPEKAESLDRFFVDMQPSSAPDPHLLGDFMVSGEHTLAELAGIYGVKVGEEEK